MPKVLNKHFDTPTANTIYCGRGSLYGNPFKIGKHGTRDMVCDRFEAMIENKINLPIKQSIITELKGKDLMCYCAPKRCHCDYLLRIANDL